MNATSGEIAAAVTLLSGMFKVPAGDVLFEAYDIGLKGITGDQLRIATARALAECKFMPIPVELRAFAGIARNLPAEIAQAWDVVRAAIDKHDYTVKSIDFGSRVNAVIRNLGGWGHLCRAGLKELDVWLRKDFERLYTAFADADGDALNGEPLRGGGLSGYEVRIAIGPASNRPQLEAVRSPEMVSARAAVRALAEAKSSG